MHYSFDEWITGHMDLCRAPCQCKHNVDIIQTYKIYKYIQNIYICLQCFATTMRLQCVFWSSTCVLLTRTRPDRSCIYLNFIMLLPSKQTNKKRHTVLNPSSLHLRWSQKFWPIKSSFYIWKRLRYTTKDFPGGCKRLKQILFIVLEWKKNASSATWLGPESQHQNVLS